MVSWKTTRLSWFSLTYVHIHTHTHTHPSCQMQTSPTGWLFSHVKYDQNMFGDHDYNQNLKCIYKPCFPINITELKTLCQIHILQKYVGSNARSGVEELCIRNWWSILLRKSSSGISLSLVLNTGKTGILSLNARVFRMYSVRHSILVRLHFEWDGPLKLSMCKSFVDVCNYVLRLWHQHRF